MSILNKFVLKDLSLNKKRTIVTIIGIILSTALLCAVSGMVTSFYKTLLEYEKNANGDFHVSIYDMEPKDVEKLKKNNEIENFFYFYKQKGYSKLEDSKNEYKPYLYLLGFDKNSLSTLNLIEGRLPEKDDEIVIPYHISSSGKVSYEIGDILNLSVSDRISEGYSLSQSNPFDEDIEEHLEEKYAKEYKIVGIISRPNIIIEPYSAPGFSVITLEENFSENSQENITVSFRFKNPKGYKSKTEKILNNTNPDYLYEYNTGLLRIEGSALSNSTMSMLYSVAGVVIVIIIVSSIFVIKNSFSISITEKIRQYGILSSIGATSKQIKKNVLFEGFVLGIIAIPIGILSGIFAVFVLIHLINYILADALNGIKFVYSVPLLPILFSILFASITIYFSSIFSARKASKISPIEAIRSNTEIKISSKKVRSSKIIKKLFKVGGDISYKNLKRNKRKYRSTVISLVVSIAIFISLSSFLDFGFKMSNEYYKEMDYNLVVYSGNYQEENQSKVLTTFEDIAKLDNIKDYSIVKTKGVLISDSYLSDFGKLYYDITEIEKDNNQFETIMAVGDTAFKKFVKEIGGKLEDYEDKGILINNTTFFYENKKKNGDMYNIKAGDTIELKTIENSSNDETIPGDSFNIEIAMVVDKRPMGITSETGIVVSDKMMEKLKNYSIYNMYIMSDNSEKLNEDIENLLASDEKYNKNTHIYDYEEARKSENAMVLVVSIFLYGFITVITLIAVTNIFNTITTTMNLRQKEFAMLKSIGMTKKEFNRMIKLESIFYGSKSLFLGIPIGILGSYFVYKAFAEGMDMSYRLPFSAIILSIIFVFLIVGLIMKYSLDKINKQNIIETIRKENI